MATISSRSDPPSGESQDALVEALKSDFAKRRKRNARYSLRAYARHFALDSSTLSKILAQSRPVGARLRARLVARLELPFEERQALLVGHVLQKLPPGLPESGFTRLTAEQIRVASRWEFYATLSALEIPSVKGSPPAVAKLIGADIVVVRRCLAMLERFGFLKKAGKRYHLQNVNLTAPPNVSREWLFRAHLNHLRLVKDHMTRGVKQPYAGRRQDFSGITLAADSRRIDEAVAKIRDFRRGLAKFLNGGTVDCVYRLNVQLFPFE